MNVSTSLVAKGAAGALATSTAIGGGVMANKHGLFGNFFGASAEAIEGTEDGESLQAELETARDGEPKAPEVPKVETDSEPKQETTNTVSVNTDGTEPRDNDTAGGPDVIVGGQKLPKGEGQQTQSTADNISGRSGSEGQTSIEIASSDNANKAPTNNSGPGSLPLENTSPGNSAGKTQNSDQNKEPTKWDNALINYLKESGKDDRDIAFTVKTGKNASEALSNNFPAFEDEEIKGKKNKQKSTITVSVTTDSSSLTGADSGDEIKKLKNMNGGNNWTWECKIVFSKDKDDLDLEDKEKIIGTDGFFNKLTESDEKDLKIKFIENCAKVKSSKPSKETLDNEKIIHEKIFDLEKGDGTWKVNKDKFTHWFSKSSRRKQSRTPT